MYGKTVSKLFLHQASLAKAHWQNNFKTQASIYTPYSIPLFELTVLLFVCFADFRGRAQAFVAHIDVQTKKLITLYATTDITGCNEVSFIVFARNFVSTEFQHCEIFF